MTMAPNLSDTPAELAAKREARRAHFADKRAARKSDGARAFMLTNRTSGRSWCYDSEPQLRTAARLFALQNPHASVSVTINGATTVLR